MKMMLKLRKHDYLARISIFLIMVALIAGMVGCGGAGVESYTLTITSTTGGSVVEPGEGTFTYIQGAVVDLVAEAAEGYIFVSWTGDVGTIADVNTSETTITMNGGHTIMANFMMIAEYDLTISSTAGGSVTSPGEGTFTYYEGTVVDVVAEAGEGYYFVNWTGDVDTIGNVNAAITTITMQDDYEITANFEQIPPDQFALTVSSTSGGSVTVPGEATFIYDEGTVVDLVATPEPGCRFLNWSGNVDAIADVNSTVTAITMNGNYSITANFLPFAGGSGTAGDPYQIANWYHLHNVRHYLDDHFILIDNLYFSTTGYAELASPTANDGKGWQPIGSPGNPFTGNFDGQGYEIHDLFVNRPYVNYVGLFSYVSGGAIEYIGMVNATVTGGSYVASLVGCIGINGGTVSNSYSSGDVTGDAVVGLYASCIGGLVGYNNGIVTNSYSSGNVTGDISVGGLVGYNALTVSNSHSIVGVTGDIRVGGLVGTMGTLGGSVINSYFTGSLTGSSCVGGVVGETTKGTVSNSYYNYDEVPINGQSIITIGALFDGDFDQWLAGGKSLDINERLSQNNGYYQINNVSDFKELLAFGQNDSLKFRLESDLDLATQLNFFVPYLAGEFDGNDHKISNLSFNLASISQTGLFGHLGPGGKVTRVGVENVNITSYLYVGSLVGYIHDGTVSDSYSSGTTSGTAFVGGLVGMNDDGTVSNSYSSITITGNYALGGLAGHNSGTVSNCYSNGNVSGTAFVGGLVGESSQSTVTNSFWDIQTSGQATSAGGTGKTTAEMKDITTFSGATWDITAVADPSTRNLAYIWNIVDNVTYPFLSWQPVS
jgi:hypothetical protein